MVTPHNAPATRTITEPVMVDAAAPAADVLLAGRATRALRGELGRPAAWAESMLEAILLAPRGYHTIAVGVHEDLPQLPAAVRALREAAPDARIVLVCDPWDEPATRKAAAQGADDYVITPPRADQILHSVSAPEAAVAGATVATEAGMSIPLAVQTATLDDLLAGRVDFAHRLVQRLADALPWARSLQLIAPDTAADALPPGGVTVEHDGLMFGTLALDAGAGAREQGFLAELMPWVARHLAMARRDAQLRSLAITDELSGAYNRRYFEKFVSGLLDKARKEHFRVSLLMFDIDNFKQYNDAYGHAAGDEIIRQLIALLRRCTRPHDLVARIGGDEFAVVFWDNEAPRQPNSQHPRDAIAASERFRRAIAAHDWCGACKIQGVVSISGGIATFPWDAGTLGALCARADEALLRAKGKGKNAIVLHERPEGAPDEEESL